MFCSNNGRSRGSLLRSNLLFKKNEKNIETKIVTKVSISLKKSVANIITPGKFKEKREREVSIMQLIISTFTLFKPI